MSSSSLFLSFETKKEFETHKREREKRKRRPRDDDGAFVGEKKLFFSRTFGHHVESGRSSSRPDGHAAIVVVSRRHDDVLRLNVKTIDLNERKKRMQIFSK